MAHIYDEIRLVMVRDWDPLNIAMNFDRVHEYDAFIPHMMSAGDELELTLLQIERELGVRHGDNQRRKLAAKNIYKLLQTM